MNPARKIRVIHIITKSNWGGAQRYVFDIATGLPQDTYGSSVILGGNGPLVQKLQEAHIPVTSLARLGRDVRVSDDFRTFVDLIKIFRKNKPDVIHLNSSKIGGLGALAGRIAGVPRIIFTAHGWAFNENRSLTSKMIIKMVYWITMVLAHTTIAVSEHMKSSVVSWPFINQKITVIHNGVRTTTAFSRINARYELYKYHPELKMTTEGVPAAHVIWIGTIAELHHVKGYDITLRGMKHLIDSMQQKENRKHLIYTIIGAGEERERFEHLSKELGLEKHVFFLGHLDSASQYLKAFDMFLLTSRSEGLGYVLLEAGLAEIPCVATAVGGIPEIIDDMQSGVLIQSEKPEEVAYAIDFMIQHKKIQKEYAVALHKKVLDRFSVQEMIKKTSALYTLPSPPTDSDRLMLDR